MKPKPSANYKPVLPCVEDSWGLLNHSKSQSFSILASELGIGFLRTRQAGGGFACLAAASNVSCSRQYAVRNMGECHIMIS
jgi:hypothetical protein